MREAVGMRECGLRGADPWVGSIPPAATAGKAGLLEWKRLRSIAGGGKDDVGSERRAGSVRGAVGMREYGLRGAHPWVGSILPAG